MPISDSPGEHWITAGMRLRGSHDAVQRFPHFCVREGSDHVERAQARERLRPVDAA
jgi:hypothetical protein